LIEPVLARHGGRFVDLKGDGAVVEFQSAVAAIEAAVEIQQAMPGHDPELPEAERIRYRIGVNLGEVIVDGGTIYGDGVNVAARIESLCEPGAVWLARNVHDQVKSKLDLVFAPTGRYRVKNLREPVETLRVVLDGVAPARPRATIPRAVARRWLPPVGTAALLALVFLGGVWHFRPGEPPPKERPGIAVLPFDNLGGDEATGRLADGITEDTITDLARFRGLDVIARNSTEAYKGKPVDVRKVGKDLDVGYVLEGSIQRQADEIRVTAQLIDSSTRARARTSGPNAGIGRHGTSSPSRPRWPSGWASRSATRSAWAWSRRTSGSGRGVARQRISAPTSTTFSPPRRSPGARRRAFATAWSTSSARSRSTPGWPAPTSCAATCTAWRSPAA
jgi:TolB-like protein